MKWVFIKLIRVYQYFLSPETGVFVRAGIVRKRNVCPFYPTCSEYAAQSIHLHGAIKGAYRSAKRIMSCHPWQKPRIDLP